MNLPMSKEQRDELLATCAPSSQNNERRYWANKIDRWNKSRLQGIGEEIADRFGLGFDYKNGYDMGNEPVNNN